MKTLLEIFGSDLDHEPNIIDTMFMGNDSGIHPSWRNETVGKWGGGEGAESEDELPKPRQ